MYVLRRTIFFHRRTDMTSLMGQPRGARRRRGNPTGQGRPFWASHIPENFRVAFRVSECSNFRVIGDVIGCPHQRGYSGGPGISQFVKTGRSLKIQQSLILQRRSGALSKIGSRRAGRSWTAMTRSCEGSCFLFSHFEK